MKKYLITALLLIATAPAFAGSGASAGGNGTGAAASSSSYGGANGYGQAQLGNFPNSQTMNPIDREKYYKDNMPKQASVASAKAQWPAWVHIDNNDSQIAAK